MTSRAILLTLCLTGAAGAAAAQDLGPPHSMVKADGSLDMQACGACHNDDMSLQRSKLETCTLCHAERTHAGSYEHVHADAATVKRAMGDRSADAPALPLADDGRLYCGTCHLYHDPKVMSEAWLPQGWIPPDSGLPEAVRDQIDRRWAALAERAGSAQPVGTFAARGTRMLRLPVSEGQLCRQCHGVLP